MVSYYAFPPSDNSFLVNEIGETFMILVAKYCGVYLIHQHSMTASKVFINRVGWLLYVLDVALSAPPHRGDERKTTRVSAGREE